MDVNARKCCRPRVRTRRIAPSASHQTNHIGFQGFVVASAVLSRFFVVARIGSEPRGAALRDDPGRIARPNITVAFSGQRDDSLRVGLSSVSFVVW